MDRDEVSSERIDEPMNASCDKVFIVDDDSAVCDTLSTVFTSAGYWTSAFTDGRSFLRVARLELPTCVLLKVGMSFIPGFDILRELDARKYAAPILILSSHDDMPNVAEAVRSGAFDIVEKNLDAETMVSRVRDIVATWMSTRQNGSSEFSFQSFPGYYQLTDREREVLVQITAAASNKEAARNLGISPRTVEVHRGHIMHKLGAKNSVDLTRIVLSKGSGR